MDNERVNTKAYMTVGEVAKKMKTTVRTLQYYDKEGILSPSNISEGGRRLYTDKDIIKLHQILSMKYLGFSLFEIKNKLISLETPQEITQALNDQAEIISKKITDYSEVLDAIEKLAEETSQMKSVDFKKYADIVVLLQMKNENFWVVKNFDNKVMDHVRNHFDEKSGIELLDRWLIACQKAIDLKDKGIDPKSEEGIKVAEEWWAIVTEFTGGDMSLIPELMKFAENREGWDSSWNDKMTYIDDFIKIAMEAYFTKLGGLPQGIEI